MTTSKKRIQNATLPTPKNLRLHIAPEWDIDGPTFAFVIYDNKDQVVQAAQVQAEPLLFNLLNKKSQQDKNKLLHDILSLTNHITNITVRVGDETLPLTWNGSNKACAITELDIVNNQVNVRCNALQSDGIIIDDIVYLNEHFIVDAQRKTLVATLQGNQWGWPIRVMQYLGRYIYIHPKYRAIPELQRACDPETNHSWLHRAEGFLPIDLETLNAVVPIVYEVAASQLVGKIFALKHENNPIAITPAPIRHIIHGTIDSKEGTITLTPHVINKQLDQWLWYPLTIAVQQLPELDAWLKTKTRRAMIMQALFEILRSRGPKDAEKTIKETLKNLRASHPRPRHVSTEQLKRMLERYSGWIVATHERLMADNQAFYSVSINYPSLLRSLPLIHTLFPEAIVPNDYKDQLAFTLPTAIFYKKFAEFNKLITKEKIEFQIDGKKVETISLDIAFNVENSRNQGGWFDLDPHVMANGITLSAEQREVLFNGTEQLETADCIKILDEESRSVLHTLAKIFHSDSLVRSSEQGARTIMHIPKLRILDLLELRQAGAKVRLAKEDEQLLQRLTNFSEIIPVALPKKFNGSLRKYQKDGYQWLAFLYAHNFGACLADDMGLGKTVQAIAFLGGLHENIIKGIRSYDTHMPHLIVVPPTLLFNWQAELEKFYPSFRVIEYLGQPHDILSQYDIVLSTYDRVRIHIESLKNIQFHAVIFDEAQTIKNIHAARTTAARQIKSIFTITLTGTPLENHIGEYHSIIDLALPGLLPDYKHFMRYAGKGEHEFFIKKTRAFVLRRTKAAIIKDLPPKVTSNIVLPMDEKQQKIYATTTLEVKRAIESAYDKHTSAQANIIALTALLRLRQICVSPQIIDSAYDIISPKLEYLMRTLGELNSEGNAALVFSQFTTCLDLIEKLLKTEAIPYFRIDGSTPMGKRKKIIEEFQNGPQSSVLLLSLKTGGVGLNLTRANYVFHVDIWWNPAVENQATDRSHRIGQKNKVFMQRLIMNSTIEEKVLDLQDKKAKLFKDVVEQAQNKQKGTITKKDLDFLLG